MTLLILATGARPDGLASGQTPEALPEGYEIQEVNGREFVVPAGLVLELAAGPDLAPRPIVADFDDRGNLFVADSSGTNDRVEVQLEERPHRILLLRDTDHDRTFDQQVVFADRMMFPEGILCHRGAVYVAAPPHIWKLTDDNGDGVCDRREVWFDGKTLTGCANDLHGPYLGPDGWIYWCKGAFAEQTYDRPEGESWTTRAAHIFRRHPDGGQIEAVMTGGMDNPVEVAFSRAGERFFTTTFLQHPAGGRRDGVIHAVYGGVYGKPHGVLEGHARTGDLMPVMSHLGPAAPSGLVRLESDGLGQGYRDNLVSAAFNLHQVWRHQLQSDGATFASVDTPLVQSPDLDFHPTDVLEDADGSLLIVDTGGWYKLCCPTSQLHKPDVLGAVYRLRRRDETPELDPRGNNLAWNEVSSEELTARITDPRFAVRQRSIESLVVQGSAAVPTLVSAMENQPRAEVRCHLVWTACRIGLPAALPVVRQGLIDSDPLVRQAALHAVAVWRAPGLIELVAERLQDESLQVRRTAAEAAGRLGAVQVMPALVEALGESPDRVLEHSLLYAMIESASAEHVREAFDTAPPVIQARLAMVLDQIAPDRLGVSDVVPLLGDADPTARQRAAWVAQRHPTWANSLARAAILALQESDEASVKSMWQQIVAPFAHDVEVQRVLADLITEESTDRTTVDFVVAVLSASRAERLDVTLENKLASAVGGLQAGHEEFLERVLGSLEKLPRFSTASPLGSKLAEMVRDASRPESLRFQALGRLEARSVRPPDELTDRMLEVLREPTDHSLRSLSAKAIAQARFEQAELLRLTELFPSLDPLSLSDVCGAFSQQTDQELGEQFVRQLAASPARHVVAPGRLEDAVAKFPEDLRQRALRCIVSDEVSPEEQIERLEGLLENLPSGDVRRGQAVFHSAKAACFSCHAMGYRGGDIGPDLTRIGRIRAERDLLEAIVYPSQSFVRSYEPLQFVLLDGRVLQGVVRDQSSEVVTLVDAQRQEHTVARNQIEAVEPSRVSIMPSGLDQLLSRQEIADLLAFLQAAK